MTTVVLFGAPDTPISSITLADTFRLITADEFISRMMNATRQYTWNRDVLAIKGEAIFTLDGFARNVHLRLTNVSCHPHEPVHYAWFDTFMQEVEMLWCTTPSVVVIKMIVSLSTCAQLCYGKMTVRSFQSV